MTDQAQGLLPNYDALLDSVVEVRGNGAATLGVLIADRLVLTLPAGDATAVEVAKGDAKVRAHPVEGAGEGAPLTLLIIASALPARPVTGFGRVGIADIVFVATPGEILPTSVLYFSTEGTLVLHSVSAPPGAPVFAAGALVAVVIAPGAEPIEAVPLTDVAASLARWVPRLGTPLRSVGSSRPRPSALLDLSLISGGSAALLGWFDAVLAHNREAPADAALWAAFLRMAPASGGRDVSALVPRRLRSTGPGELRAPSLPDGSGPSRIELLGPVEAVAVEIRDEIEPGEVIALRHLLAAAIEVWPVADIDGPSLREDLLSTLEHDAPPEIAARWRRRLTQPLAWPPPPAAAVSTLLTRRAGIDTDAVDGSTELHDELRVCHDVVTLCDVLAARDAAPPISVGLFGQWGTGKSYFMALMRRRMAELAAVAKEVPPDSTSSYCRHIEQITFNAWHYMDANLWASLAVRLFDGMAALEQQDARPSEEKAQVLLAEIRKRERALTKKDRQVLRALDDPRVAELAEKLGVDAQRSELREFFEQQSVLRRYLWALKPKRWTGPRRRAGLLVLAGTLPLVAVGAVVATQAAVSAALLAWVPAALAALTSLGRVGRKVSQALKDLNEFLVASSLKPAEVSTTMRKDEALAKLRDELTEVQRGRDAYEYVLARARSDDYRRHFGLISVVRADLEGLATRLRDESLDRRIVLYIDDLDRCPPAKVVEVLQAVHLMLAFPLFVVVVGVDPRWLLRSLERHYREILSTGHAGPDTKLITEDLTEATPHDYLEKIFQIPFSLAPMGEAGFGRLVAKLIGAEPSDVYRAGLTKAAAAATATAPPPSGEPDPTPTAQVEPTDRPPVPETASPPSTAPAPVAADPSPPAPEPAPPLAPIDANSARLEVSPDEVAALSALTPLIPTPRSAKRLINVYRLIKAGRPDEELDAFIAERRYEPLVLLLGALIGFPREASELFEALAAAAAGEPVRTFLDEQPDELATAIKKVLDVFERRTGAHPILVRDLNEWAAEVQRYSFEGALVAAASPSGDSS